MNLKELINEIGEMAIEQKCIHYSAAGTSLSQLDPLSITEYPALFQSPTGSHQVKENTTSYELTLYYIDRLLTDYSNDIDVYSAGIEQLKNIIIGIKFIVGVVNVEEVYSIRNFATTEKMNDSLGGAYATVRIEIVNDSTCFQE